MGEVKTQHIARVEQAIGRICVNVVAHAAAVPGDDLLQRREPFRELGGAYYDQRSQAQLIKRTERRFAKLGLKLTVEPLQPAA